MATRITKKTLIEGIEALAAKDTDVARVYRDIGPPPLRARPPGFATLVKIICAQQVSTASARAIIGRLEAAARPLTPETFLALDDSDLKAIGFSGVKMGYGRGLAAAIRDGRLNLRSIARKDDEDAIAELVTLRGIGRWTAEIYLLFALRRPNLWPVDDLAVVKGVQWLKGLSKRPSRDEMIAFGEAWRPWRSVAARLLWHANRNAPPDR